jgi:hypothetical protein
MKSKQGVATGNLFRQLNIGYFNIHSNFEFRHSNLQWSTPCMLSQSPHS